MKKWIALIMVGMTGYSITTNAQNTGGIWMSGTNLTSEGTGMHNGESAVLSLDDSLLNTMPAISGGIGAGKLVLGDLRIRKAPNGSSVALFSALGKGTHIPNISFKYYQRKASAVNAANAAFNVSMTLSLTNVIVRKYRLFTPDCTGNNCPIAMEEIYLGYEKIQLTDAAGNSVQLQGQ